MSSTFTLARALSAAEAHGRQEGTALQASGVQDSHRLWLGRGGGSWCLSKPDFYIFFLSCGRPGRDDLCRGDWQPFFPHSKNAMDLIQRDLMRQKAVRVISLSETNFLRYLWIFLDIWYAGAGRVFSQAEGTPLLQYFRHARRVIEAGPHIGGNHGDPEWRSGGRGAVRPPTVHPHGEKGCEISERLSVFGIGAEDEKYQILIKTLSGKTILVWVSANDTGKKLKDQIAQREGYPRLSFYILYRGKVLPEGNTLRDYQINKNSTLHVLFHLQGGTNGNRRTAGPSSYKDAARSKGPHASATPPSTQPKGPHASAIPLPTEPRPYIVEKLDDIPALEVKITEGPWFWGQAGLFLTPWFPEFDADTMVVTKMPVWVRLPNLPLPFWHHEVLEDIGNLLGKYIISDSDRKEQGLFTYARICVEIDLSKGLPDKIQLQHETFKRIQALDYENTAFRCRSCNMTGHLHDSCPHARRFPKKKKGLNPKRKTWQADYDPSINEESECEESDTEGKQREEENEEAAPFTETREAKNSDSKKADPKNEGEEPQSVSGNHMADKDDSSPGEGTQTAIVIHEGVPTGGIKRGHESEKSDSDKEQPSIQKPEMVNGRQVVVATSSQGRWVEVKNKRKGKKGKIEDYYQH